MRNIRLFLLVGQNQSLILGQCIGKTMQKVIILLMATFFLMSCGTWQSYEGPRLNRDQVALIKTRCVYYGLIFSLQESYVKIVDQNDHFALACQNAEVLPGKHTINIGYSESLLFAQRERAYSFDVDFREGGTYQIDFKTNNNQVYLWILDEQTNKIVAGSL